MALEDETLITWEGRRVRFGVELAPEALVSSSTFKMKKRWLTPYASKVIFLVWHMR
jgi:hypothetical protein